MAGLLKTLPRALVSGAKWGGPVGSSRCGVWAGCLASGSGGLGVRGAAGGACACACARACARARRRGSLQPGLGGSQLWLQPEPAASRQLCCGFTGYHVRPCGPGLLLRSAPRVGGCLGGGGAGMQCSGRLARVRTRPGMVEHGGTGSRAGLVPGASSMLRGHRGTARLPRVNAAVGSGTRDSGACRARGRAREYGVSIGIGPGPAGVFLSGWFPRVRSGKRRKGSHAFPPVAGESGLFPVPPGTPAVRALP